MRRLWKIMVSVFVLSVLMGMTAFAAGWTTGQGSNSSRWWYDLGNGHYYGNPEETVEWQWLDGNGDGVTAYRSVWHGCDAVLPEADLLQRGRPRPVSADLLKIDGTSGCHPERGESAGLSVQHCKRHLEK